MRPQVVGSPSGVPRAPGEGARFQALPRIPWDHGLRATLGHFLSGVTVITFADDDGPHGFTANAFTSVSIDPPLVLVSVGRSRRSHDRVAAGPFTVNVLDAEQEWLARRFSGGDSDVAPRWCEGRLAPRLDNVLAWLECEPWRTYEGGDHSLLLGEVKDYEQRRGEPLAYFTSRFTRIIEPPDGHEYLI